MSTTTFARLALEFMTKGAAEAERETLGVERASERAERSTDKLSKSSRKATDALGSMGGGARKATDSLKGMTAAASALGGILGKVVALIGGGLLTGALAKMADSWSDMRSQLGAAIGDMGGANAMMKRMVDIANASYSPLDQTVTVYARNVTVLRDLGKTAQEAADFTESLNHMLVITATKGERAASVQNALSKAMAVGKMDGDGLETVLANAARVAEALADELGTTTSGLRGFASEGKITGQVIANALIKPLEDVRKVAGEMNATIGDALLRLSTNMLYLVGVFDQAASASLTVAGGIISIADSVKEYADGADFSALLTGAADSAAMLLQIVIVLGATRIPALASAVTIWARATWAANAATIAATASTRLMVAQMYAGVIAARGLAGALALAGGPLGVILAGGATLGMIFWNASTNAAALSQSLRDVADAQGRVNDASAEFYRLRTEEAYKAWKAEAEAQKFSLEKALKEAEDARWYAEFKAGMIGAVPIFGALLSEGMTDQEKAAIEEIKRQLFEVEGILSLIDHAWANVSSQTRAAGGAAASLTKEQQKALTTAQEMIRTSEQRIQQARVEVRHGKDSNLAQINALRTEREIMWAKVNTLDVSRDIKQTIMDTWWEQQQAEGQTHAWDAAANILKGTLGDAWAAVQAVSSTEPGKGWLDTAIGKAQSLFGVLSNAYERMLALNNQDTGSMTWFKGLSGADLLPPTVPKKTGTGRKGGGGGKSAAAQELEDMAEAAKSWKDRILQAAPATERFRRELAELDKLHRAGKLSTAEHAEAVDLLREELADSYPLVNDVATAFGDFVAGGLKDFGGFVKSILGSFKRMLAEMVTTAARNRIMIGMGMTGGGAGAAAAGAVGPAGDAAGQGFLGGALSGVGTFFSSIWSGASGLFTALQGGLGAAGTYMSSILGTATTSVGAFGAAIGAIAGPLAAVGLIFSFFGKKTKELDRGLRVTVDGLSSFVEEFRTIETKRFWGLSKKVRTHYETADEEAQDAIGRAVAHLQTGILNAAAVLDFGASTFKGFAHTLEVSTKDLSEDEALKAVQDAVMELGDAFAGMVPGLKDQILYGEGATQALERLAGSLTATRAVADLLGHRFTAAGLAGGILADHLAQAFGGIDAMTGAVQSYWQSMYSEQERLDTVTRQATTALATLGLQMPKSRAEYRAMVDALDLNAAGAHEAYAALVSLAGVFDQILPSVHGLTAALAELQGNAQTGLDGAISAAAEAAKANSSAAASWYKASGSIRDWIEKLRGTASPLTNPAQARANAETSYQSTLARALAGDLAAANEATGAADRLLAAVRNTARTQTEAAVAEARILSDMGLLAGVGDIEGARHDVIRGLLEQQVDAMTEVRDAIAGGAALTEAQISALLGQLGALDDAIAAAEMINYAYLKERLQVTVDVLADANIPAHLKALLANASNGVTGYVDFITRSDLTPDLKWLAMTGASQHIKTLRYLADNRLGSGLTSLALDTVSGLQKTVHLLAGRTLDADTVRIALAGNSELSRTVTATLAANIPADAKRLALGNVGAYAVSVMASFAPNISAEVRRLVLTQQGTYAASITAAVSQQMTPEARRILLIQQGAYIANVTGVLASGMDNATRALLLNANTSATRAVTVAVAFPSTLTDAQRAALLASSGTITRTVFSNVGLPSLSEAQRAALLASTATITRTIKGVVDASSLTPQQLGLLSAITGATAGKVTLGGSFVFDPTSGFKSWYETSTQSAISKPMDALRAAMGPLQTALGALRDALASEAAKQAASHGAQTGLQSWLSTNGVVTDSAGVGYATEDQIFGMAKAAGLSTAGKSLAALRTEIAAVSSSDAIKSLSAITSRDDLLWSKFKAMVVPPDPADYLRLYPDATKGGLSPAAHYAAHGRAEILSGARAFKPGAFDWDAIGLDIPGFAAGGTHLGGLRIVGEQGPELEATGPSRIYSAGQTRQMLGGAGNAELLAELRALRAELADLKAIGAKGNEHSRDMSKILKRIDALGIKLDEDQNAVKVEA